MRTSFSTLMLAAGVLAAAAMFGPESDATITEPSPPIIVTEGMVLNVGQATITIRVMSGNDDQSFWVAQDARITLDGRPVNLNELFMGNHAKVTAFPKQNRFVASVIEARSPM